MNPYRKKAKYGVRPTPGTRRTPQRALVSSKADGSITVSHREYLRDIFGPADNKNFDTNTIAINPGLNQCFPWLAQLASNYEEYQWKSLYFYYRSTTTDIGSSSTGQCGTTAMVTNYNASAAPFTDKQSLIEYIGAQSAKVTEDLKHNVICKNQTLFVRNGTLDVSQDIKTYDLGQFQLAICNSPTAFANYPVGELWVYYVITLKKPKLYASRGYDIMQDWYTTPLTNANTLAPNSTNGIFGAISGKGNLLKNSLNNLNTVITITAKNKLRIDIPPSYIGSLRFILQAIPTETVAGAALNVRANDFFAYSQGSTYQIDDQSAFGAPNWEVGNNILATSTTAALQNASIYIADINIQPPAPGTTNNVTIDLTHLNAVTSKVAFAIYIMQSNQFGLLDTSSVPKFTKLSTGTAYDILV